MYSNLDQAQRRVVKIEPEKIKLLEASKKDDELSSLLMEYKLKLNSKGLVHYLKEKYQLKNFKLSLFKLEGTSTINFIKIDSVNIDE